MVVMRLVLVCALVAACGGSSSSSDKPGDDTPGPTIPPEQYTDAVEDAQCTAMVRCEQVEDAATCDAANIRVNQDQQSLLAAVADGTVIYDGEAAAKCVDELAMQMCVFPGFHVDTACADVFTGTVATGGACFVDQQCAGGGACRQNDSGCDTRTTCCIGTCMGSLTESALGGQCGDSMHYCSPETYCAGTTCAAPITQAGAACGALDACANPMICNLDFMTGTGTCKTPAATGAACVRADLRPCADSRDYCDAGTLKCTHGVAPGGSCATAECVDWAKCMANTCVAERKLGETCSTAANAPSCAGTLKCTAGTCQAPPAGMTCKL
jgi:hypothetical protein